MQTMCRFYQKYHELRARIKANSCPILPAKQQQLNNSNNSSNSNSQNNNSNSSNSNNNINNNSNNSNNINNSKSNINTNIINNPTSALGNVYTPIPNYSVQRSASLKDHRNYRFVNLLSFQFLLKKKLTKLKKKYFKKINKKS